VFASDCVVEAIRAESPAIPVIMLTGFGDMMKTRGEVPPGVDAVVGKLVRYKQLMRTVEEVLAVPI